MNVSSRNLILCLCCGQTQRKPHAGLRRRERLVCRRCHEPLAARKPRSLQRCWALVIAGLILYLPANLYPVMITTIVGREAHLTVWGGVCELYDTGMPLVALLVFCASIVVPLLKLLAMVFVLINTSHPFWPRKDLARLYRIVESIGKWSMVDIFLLSILVALGQLGVLATVVPQIGAVAFCAVVVLTLYAVDFYDPRLIWDNRQPETTP
ncbi:MAG: paraquat-inducible protein A [Verrucomicrobiae bacterium]|nr:paraquat-inducible protein A [Verrucomicrobiae bacterium]